MNDRAQTILGFVDDSREYRLLSSYFRKRKESNNHLVSWREVSPSDVESVQLHSHLEFEDDQVFADVNEQGIDLSMSWCEDRSMKEIVHYNGVNFGSMVQQRFRRDIIFVLKRIVLIREILNRIKPSSVVLIEYTHLETSAALNQRIVEAVAKEKGIDLVRVEDMSASFPSDKKPAQRRSVVKVMLNALSQLPRKLVNYFLELRSPKVGNVLFSMSYNQAVNIFDKPWKYGVCQLREFMDFRHFYKYLKNRVSFLTVTDFKTSQRCKLEIEERYQKFIRQENRTQAFCCLGIDLYPLLKSKIKQLFNSEFLSIAHWTHSFHNLFNKKNIRAVLVDEDLGMFNRTLVDIARSYQIPTISLLHGVPASLYRTSSIADVHAVWGQYEKDVLIQKGVPAEQIEITGNPGLDKVYEENRDRAHKNLRERVFDQYQIPRENKLVVLATQHYADDDKPAIINIHHTKSEIEELLHSTLSAIEEIESTTLIIKMHPRDPRELFTKRIVRKYDMRKKVIVLRDIDGSSLLQACDILIGTKSSILLEGIALEKPVITVNYSSRPDIHPYAEKGAAVAVKKPSEMKTAIESLLFSAEAVERLAKSRNNSLPYFIEPAQGRAAEAVIKLVNRLIENCSFRDDSRIREAPVMGTVN